MPRHDDKGIPNSAILIRAVRPDWILAESERERLISGTFVDGSLEASCFIADEVGGLEGFIKDFLPELSEDLGLQFRLATLSVSVIRARGLWVYRKPEEYKSNPAHVVICASDLMSKSQYRRNAAKLAESATLL